MTVRRMKTYTGGQGCVYQYYFVGKRRTGADEEYIFDVTADRKTTYAVSVFLPAVTLQEWASSHNRGLTDAEQYGAVKMRLFQAFDEVEDLMSHRQLRLDSAMLKQLLTVLGVDH